MNVYSGFHHEAGDGKLSVHGFSGVMSHPVFIGFDHALNTQFQHRTTLFLSLPLARLLIYHLTKACDAVDLANNPLPEPSATEIVE